MVSCKSKSHESCFHFQSVVLWYEQLLVLTAVSASWKEHWHHESFSLYTVCSVLNVLNSIHSLFFLYVCVARMCVSLRCLCICTCVWAYLYSRDFCACEAVCVCVLSRHCPAYLLLQLLLLQERVAVEDYG